MSKKDLRELTAWRRLERTRNVFNEILEATESGKDISETQLATIQQELLISVGNIATFSECLVSGEIHE